jgi:hypothetical protein
MLSRTLQRRISLLAASLIATATVSIDGHSVASANVRRTHQAHISRTYPRHAYASRRHGPWFAHGATLPYGPEYGFLRRVPPNAIGGPGYTFVPGVGILGESCDLPTSACTNEYRDVR